MSEVEEVWKGTVGDGVTAPSVGPDGSVYVMCTQTGSVQRVFPGTPEVVANTGGSPAGLAVGRDGVFFLCDMAHGSVLTLAAAGSPHLAEFVKEYEGRPLKGPQGICFDSTGTLYFSDSGPFGEGSLQRPRGSVFLVSSDGQLLQPVLLECLAHPWGVATDVETNCVFVAETLNNRILRLTPPTLTASVFTTFSGGIGPSALACDGERLFVGRYETVPGGDGEVTVLSTKDGSVIQRIKIPSGKEITGLALDKEHNCIYVTEGSSSTLYRVAI